MSNVLATASQSPFPAAANDMGAAIPSEQGRMLAQQGITTPVMPVRQHALTQGAIDTFMRDVASDRRDLRCLQPLNNTLGHLMTLVTSTATGALIGFAAGGPFGAAIGAIFGGYMGLVSVAMRHFNADDRTNALALRQDSDPVPDLQARLSELSRKLPDGDADALATQALEISQSVDQRMTYLTAKRRIIESVFANKSLPLQAAQNRLARVALAYQTEPLLQPDGARRGLIKWVGFKRVGAQDAAARARGATLLGAIGEGVDRQIEALRQMKVSLNTLQEQINAMAS